jgi:hypothetical protein
MIGEEICFPIVFWTLKSLNVQSCEGCVDHNVEKKYLKEKPAQKNIKLKKGEENNRSVITILING